MITRSTGGERKEAKKRKKTSGTTPKKKKEPHLFWDKGTKGTINGHWDWKKGGGVTKRGN